MVGLHWGGEGSLLDEVAWVWTGGLARELEVEERLWGMGWQPLGRLGKNRGLWEVWLHQVGVATQTPSPSAGKGR